MCLLLPCSLLHHADSLPKTVHDGDAHFALRAMSADKPKKAQPEISDEELEGVAGGYSLIDENGRVTIPNMPSHKVDQFSSSSVPKELQNGLGF